MRWLHAVSPIILSARCGRAASRLAEGVSPFPNPKGFRQPGRGAEGYAPGALACARSVCQLAFAG